MSERRKIEERLRRKEAEMQALEAQLREGRAYVQALQDVLKMFPKEVGQEHFSSHTATATLRSGSGVALARDAILAEGKPLHISVLLQKVGKDNSKKARISLASSLATYVRKTEIFTRPAPNTFGLIELGHTGESASAEPPADFGTGDDEAI